MYKLGPSLTNCMSEWTTILLFAPCVNPCMFHSGGQAFVKPFSSLNFPTFLNLARWLDALNMFKTSRPQRDSRSFYVWNSLLHALNSLKLWNLKSKVRCTYSRPFPTWLLKSEPHPALSTSSLLHKPKPVHTQVPQTLPQNSKAVFLYVRGSLAPRVPSCASRSQLRKQRPQKLLGNADTYITHVLQLSA